jgi:[ribosomal protein S5]-alanine N-acetyltransferase
LDRNHVFQPLTTDRLRLRELAAADARFVATLMNEPSFVEHIGDRGVRTADDARTYIASGPWTRYETYGFGLWLVERRDTGEPLGICGLLQRDALPHPDIGFAFHSAHRSNGYAFEAASRVMAFARDPLRSPRLLAIVKSSNAPSIRLLTKLGMGYERMVRLSPNASEIALYAVAFDTIPPP